MANPFYRSNDPGSQLEVRIDGADWAVEMLKQMEFAIRRRCLSAAIRAANAVMVKEARQRAPVGKTGMLKKQIRQGVKMYRDSGIVYGYIKSGARKKERKKGAETASRYAHLVMGGTNPHSIQKGDQAEMLKLPGGWYTKVQHPGAKPNPFMEEAAKASFKAAINAFESKLEERINVEQQKLSASKSAAAATASQAEEVF